MKKIVSDAPTMNIPSSIASLLIASSCLAAAAPPSKELKPEPAPQAPKYKSESPLPKGWPEPGPYNQVVRKKFPAYRAAFAGGEGQNGTFMKLFRHIQRNEIPMTAPVEMKLGEDSEKKAEMEEMAFLYQSPEVGKTGADGAEVEVRDMPALDTLSYAWQGPRSQASTKKARAAIDAELEKLKLKASGYRLLGYNSPFVAPWKQTHELQALIQP
jgi:hypothetical protein